MIDLDFWTDPFVIQCGLVCLVGLAWWLYEWRRR